MCVRSVKFSSLQRHASVCWRIIFSFLSCWFIAAETAAMTVTGFQQKALTKGYHDDESTSREEKISTNKLSVLPSLPEKT